MARAAQWTIAHSHRGDGGENILDVFEMSEIRPKKSEIRPKTFEIRPKTSEIRPKTYEIHPKSVHRLDAPLALVPTSASSVRGVLSVTAFSPKFFR